MIDNIAMLKDLAQGRVARTALPFPAAWVSRHGGQSLRSRRPVDAAHGQAELLRSAGLDPSPTERRDYQIVARYVVGMVREAFCTAGLRPAFAFGERPRRYASGWSSPAICRVAPERKRRCRRPCHERLPISTAPKTRVAVEAGRGCCWGPPIPGEPVNPS
jgi:hypothetical protein